MKESTPNIPTSSTGPPFKNYRLSLPEMPRDNRKSLELKLVRKSEFSKLAQQRISELTINKLKRDNLELVGREEEKATLRSCYLRMMTGHNKIEEESKIVEEDSINGDDATVKSTASTARRKVQGRKEMIFIKGQSGVGKSSLAMVIKEDVMAADAGLLVEGKIDLNISLDQPFSSIAKAFGKIFKEIKLTGGRLQEQIGREISSVLGSEVGALVYLIPEMEEVTFKYARKSSFSLTNGDDDYMQDRWTYTFRQLTRILTSHFTPLVLLLDDLQWIDIASEELIGHLISDVQNLNPLMIIGCYRSNEVSEDSILAKGIRSLRKMTTDFRFNFTEIELNCFQVEDINKLIMAMMSVDNPEKTMELAELCMRRTMGNPHFFVEFMSMLQIENLLKFSLGLMKWTWDLAEIESATVSTANVVELLQVRMRKLPQETQLLLQQAACLGPDFTTPTLITVWQNTQRKASTSTKGTVVRNMLMNMENETFIELCGTYYNYRWVHDKVQEAALALNAAQQTTFQFEIGRALLMSLPEKQLEYELFSVVDLLNRNQSKKSLDYAALNLRAAKKSRSLSAFVSAAKYAAKGIAILPNDKWTIGSSLALELHTLGAQMELALGQYDQANEYCREVFSQKEWNITEVLQLRMVKARLMFSVELKFNSAIDYCQDLLQDMGYKLLWSRATVPVQAISSVLRTIRTLKKKPVGFFEKLGIMTDPNDLAIASIISRIFYAAYFTDLLLAVLCTCKLVEFTLKNGMSEFSGCHLASVGGFSLMLSQDYDTSRKLCKEALLMQQMVGQARATETLHIAYAWGLIWTTPSYTCITPMEDAYITGMKAGETLFAMWNLLSSSVLLPFDLGKPLDRILEVCEQAYAQMQDVAQAGPAMVFSVYWQMITHLATPRQGDPTKLEGEIFKPEDHSLRTGPYEGSVHLATGELMVFYDIEKLGKRAVKDNGVYEKCFAGFYLIMLETFHRGVALYAMARKTKKRKYKRGARKIRKKISKWEKAGNPNVSHFVTFLNAEEAALNKKYDDAEAKYAKAIVTVARCGNLNHAALFNERYADFLLTERHDEEEAMYRWKQATRYYKDWGAHGKVQKMEEMMEQKKSIHSSCS